MISNIEVGSPWVDGRGRIITVESIDKESGKIECKCDDKCLTINIDVFTARLKPHITNTPKAVKKNRDVMPRIWVDELVNTKFGQSPNLQLSNQDWLEQGMHAKTVKFNIGQGGLPPEVNWEDHCAAIAMIDDKPAKALASLLLWGGDTNWDWSRQFDEVVQHLADNMIERCKTDGRKAPQACNHTLSELARLMARMVLHFELYGLWDVYTVKGRLQFSGIEVKASSYTTLWVRYQRQIIDDLIDMVSAADQYISSYRMQLNRVDDNA